MSYRTLAGAAARGALFNSCRLRGGLLVFAITRLHRCGSLVASCAALIYPIHCTYGARDRKHAIAAAQGNGQVPEAPLRPHAPHPASARARNALQNSWPHYAPELIELEQIRREDAAWTPTTRKPRGAAVGESSDDSDAEEDEPLAPFDLYAALGVRKGPKGVCRW